MKTISSTLLSLLFISVAFGQIGKSKITTRNLGSVVSVQPSNAKLDKVALPKSFDIRKATPLKVPQSKLNLPSRKSVKITTLRPYNPNMELWFEGSYSKDYFMLSGVFGGVVTYNAQRGKEYRMKILLTSKKTLLKNFGRDYANGSVSVAIGDENEWYSIPVNQREREINLVFTAARAGRIQIKLVGVVTPNWDWGDELWIPIKAIQVDEI
ncbi:hypothetical protein [Robiginitalea sp. IMCC43444]|uniref:hypothetical protein n=1 Tax=Robiginitalea sp. IMCC43444 TaxID=3459121 RepID=UPI0040418300